MFCVTSIFLFYLKYVIYVSLRVHLLQPFSRFSVRLDFHLTNPSFLGQSSFTQMYSVYLNEETFAGEIDEFYDLLYYLDVSSG